MQLIMGVRPLWNGENIFLSLYAMLTLTQGHAVPNCLIAIRKKNGYKFLGMSPRFLIGGINWENQRYRQVISQGRTPIIWIWPPNEHQSGRGWSFIWTLQDTILRQTK